MPTQLAFSTPPGSVSIPVGQSKELGTVNVQPFEQIRLVADERAGSAGSVRLRLTITEGQVLVAQLDEPTLAPHTQITKVYDVPGETLTLFADAIGPGTGSASVDVLVYGHTP